MNCKNYTMSFIMLWEGVHSVGYTVFTPYILVFKLFWIIYFERKKYVGKLKKKSS
jgi:hypothetical protein